MGAWGLVLLGLWVLLGAQGQLPPPAARGEYCHGGGASGGFLCPERFDGADATICCGSCALRYCCAAPEARLEQGACDQDREGGGPQHPFPGAEAAAAAAQPIYVPFLIVGSIFIAFIFVGSFVAVYCCTCLRPKQTLQQPMRFSLRSYQMETLPMILTSASLRTPSRQSGSASSSSCTAGSVHRFSFVRPESGCLVAPSPPPYTAGCLQMGHSVNLTQPSGFFVSAPYFSYPLDSEPSLTGKSIPDLSQS
ncbi:protein shisa-3 homolog [Sceloporus undulatus]|uniref:protein shisa-3 homolog n=1 Tax=Sceloporus undulatus TaxID=8520 RepID=UPI001C4AE499|nr:protein shisa-3 homolog [Sceloporus undulatus]